MTRGPCSALSAVVALLQSVDFAGADYGLTEQQQQLHPDLLVRALTAGKGSSYPALFCLPMPLSLQKCCTCPGDAQGHPLRSLIRPMNRMLAVATARQALPITVGSYGPVYNLPGVRPHHSSMASPVPSSHAV